MSQYIPFSGTAATFISNLGRIKDQIDLKSEMVIRQIHNDQIDLPSTLSELDRESVEVIILPVDVALAMHIPFGALDNKVARRIFIQEYKKYKEITIGEETVHYGISVRWIVNIRKVINQPDIASLPLLTASAQLNKLNATVRFEVLGISSNEITKLLPPSMDLKSDTYVQMRNVFDKIKEKIWSDAQIQPTILGVFGTLRYNEEQLLADAVLTSFAISRIRRGKTLLRTMKELKKPSDNAKEVIKSVYRELNNSTDPEAAITESARQKAKEIMSF